MKNYYFAKGNKELQEKIKKDSFQLSEKILDKRYELGLSFEETAKYLDLTEEEYIDYEYGEDTIPIQSYYKVIEKLEKYNGKIHLSDNIISNIKYPRYKKTIIKFNLECRVESNNTITGKVYNNCDKSFDYNIEDANTSYKEYGVEKCTQLI